MTIKKVVTFFICVLIFIFIFKVFEIYILKTLVLKAYDGDSISYLNELLEKHRLKDSDIRTQEYYLSQISSYINRILGLFILFSSLLLIYSRNNFSILKKFFLERTNPINLSILRFLLFGYVILEGFYAVPISSINLGKSALVPPIGWGFLESLPYPNISLIQVISYTFLASSILSFFGLFTRISIRIATFLGFFVIAIPMM